MYGSLEVSCDVAGQAAELFAVDVSGDDGGSGAEPGLESVANQACAGLWPFCVHYKIKMSDSPIEVLIIGLGASE